MKGIQQLRRPDGFDYAAIFALVAGVLVAGYLAIGCASSQDVPITPDPRYGVGLGLCVADVALAKEAMKRTDAGVDKAKLYERYDACARNNEAVFGFDAGRE